MSTNWLPLTEYSTKHNVSISTLRRRIKANDIKYRLDDGRYLIADAAAATHQGSELQMKHRPSQAAPMEHRPSPKLDSLMSAPADEPIFAAANRLLTELKKAYSQILQEKEEQILNLKEEVSDLKTLVRVLEAENNRLSGRQQ